MKSHPINQAILQEKKPEITKKYHLQTTAPMLDRGMNEYESKIMCTSPEIPIREKLYFRIIYETQLRLWKS